MEASPAFQIFSWYRNFLEDLKHNIEVETGNKPGNALIIVPNNRPERYLTDLYVRSKRACIVPKIITFGETVNLWNFNHGLSGRIPANELDCIAGLFECVQKLADSDSLLKKYFANMSMEEFLPWGSRLNRLMEEFFTNAIEPKDIIYPENDVSPLAASILQSLGKIADLWLDEVNKRKWITPGLANLFAARNSGHIPEKLLAKKDRPIYIAGFYILNGTQQILFKALWEHGANICLDTDPAICWGASHHHCAYHKKWINKWGAKTREIFFDKNSVLKDRENSFYSRPKINFFAGYDTHSQLLELSEILAGTQDLQNNGNLSTAIVPARENILMPILHHLPIKEVNISMGYPLSRTLLAILLNDVFAVAKSRKESGEYYGQDLLKVIQHPYLQMLKDENEINLRPVLSGLSSKINNPDRYINLQNLLLELKNRFSPEAIKFLETTLQIVIEGIGSAATTRQLGNALKQIYGFFVQNGKTIWKSFPVDTETLNYIGNTIAPIMDYNILADSQFSLDVLHGFFTDLIENRRLPFQADPISAMQILGLRETQLLNFDRIFILDATEDLLPGIAGRDPLLPDSLRSATGLPDSREKSAQIAYTLFRLCFGAKEVYFLWQEGISHSKLFSSKKIRSRFVEEFIWLKEQEQNRILKNGMPELPAAVARISVRTVQNPVIEKNAAITGQIKELLKKPFSPTLLDSFLKCPLQFLYEYIFKLYPPNRGPESENLIVGTLIHDTLAKLYQPYLGTAPDIAKMKNNLQQTFEQALIDTKINEKLSTLALATLDITLKRRLFKFLDNQPETTIIQALEKKFASSLEIPVPASGLSPLKITLEGKVDRLDERDNKLLILDYKTGNVPVQKVKKGSLPIWKDEDFFDNLSNFTLQNAQSAGETNNDEFYEGLFLELRDRIGSLQLPCYLLMVNSEANLPVENTAYVNLKKSGEEEPYFKDGVTADIVDKCAQLVQFVICYMLSIRKFTKIDDAYCDFCDYAPICKSYSCTYNKDK